MEIISKSDIEFTFHEGRTVRLSTAWENMLGRQKETSWKVSNIDKILLKIYENKYSLTFEVFFSFSYEISRDLEVICGVYDKDVGSTIYSQTTHLLTDSLVTF